jgi:hypothetical protein
VSQTNRFHQALIKAGRRGITRLDFENDPVIDGGTKILRVARCAGDLKDRGIHVVSDPHGGPGNCAVYWLAEHAPVGAVRHDGQPDRAPVPDRPVASGFQPVTFCHGCHANRPHRTQCPSGFRTETMLISPGNHPGTQACQRAHLLARTTVKHATRAA